MPQNIRRPTNRAMGTNFCATSNAGIARNHRVRANFDVVGNLHQIVDFYTVGNHRIIQSAPVNAGVSTDFNIITNHHSTQLLNFLPLAILFGKPKAIGTNNHAGMQNAALADGAALANVHPSA